MKYKIKILLKTFKKSQYQDLKDYYKVLKLKRRGCRQKEIKNQVNVSLDKIYRWTHTKSKPLIIKTLEGFNKRFNRNFSKQDMENIAYLVGYNLGDGNLSKNFCHTWFYGVDNDLLKIRKVLLKFGVKPVVYKYKIDNGKMAVHDRIFSRFLFCFGAVVGDKTRSKVEVPNWVINSKNKNVKIRFLQGLFDSELNKISKLKNKMAYQNLKLYTIKDMNNAKNGIRFLNQIKAMLKEFGITTGKAAFDRRYVRSRDNAKMQQLYLSIHSNYINLYTFITKIGFLYNSKRVQSSVDALKNIESLAKFEEEKIKKYRKVLKLRKGGLSAYKIAKILGLKEHTAKQWTYYKLKPRLFNSRNKFNTT